MQKHPIAFLAAALALLGLAAITGSGGLPSGASDTASIPLAANDSSQPVPSPEPAPGIYSAAPFTMIVVIPKPVDPGLTVAAGDATRFNLPCLKPSTRLDRR
jgi:hypothetical protein